MRLLPFVRPMGAAIGVITVFSVISLMITIKAETRNAPRPWATQPAASTAPAATPASPLPSPAQPTLPDVDTAKVWTSWAVLDIAAGTMTAGGQPGTSTTESMIKVAIAAQYIHELELSDRDPTPYEHDLLIRMIRDSDNQAAESLYRWRGGNQMLTKVLNTCQLTETRTKPAWWSETQITAGDGARLGECIADGRICSPVWAAWILGEMRQIRGEGRFGIVDARPTDRGRPLAYKNGWTLRSDGWHISCLAIADWWTMTVLVRYPASYGLDYGGQLCAGYAAALAPDNTKTESVPTAR